MQNARGRVSIRETGEEWKDTSQEWSFPTPNGGHCYRTRRIYFQSLELHQFIMEEAIVCVERGELKLPVINLTDDAVALEEGKELGLVTEGVTMRMNYKLTLTKMKE